MEDYKHQNKLTGGLRHLHVDTTDDVAKYTISVKTVTRPNHRQTGKEIEVLMNAYPITKFPTCNVYQYDVQIRNGVEKNIIIKKVWNSNARKAALKQIIFDGQKLAWSMNNYSNSLNMVVDLNQEQGRPAGRTSNTFHLTVRRKTVNLAVLNAWLTGRTSMSEAVLEAMNFLDHVLREHPSGKFLALRRSFFDEKGDNQDLGNGVLAFKGVYQAIRPALGRGLIVNVDVSNSCFWARTSFMGAAMVVLDCRDHQHLMHVLKPISDGYGGVTKSTSFYKVHRRLQKLGVQPHYRGCPCTGVDFTVKGLLHANARQYMIKIKDKATGKTEKMSVEAYFKKKYNLTLNYWELPMVEMTKKGVVYLMEVLTIHRLHRYPWKLNEYQTSVMIKYAASRPADHLNSIYKLKAILNHAKDPVLNTFGLAIKDDMIRTKARLLPSPDIQFGGNQCLSPGTNGHWDLCGKKFYQPTRDH
ncbi:PAZ domain protein [Aspergillus fischeri NRRL 181]|uniref:PAZ domain protein n=1 Tax=Neosartorya fischeri (strain ATCC 1020 / DSM 3700 / CBS 544.65 / FGSC A1164 / JCM 1740 / NRRL 181 / WB 181) TaxID=331117 RepID=A1D5I5_NEOFI|nr:PAZ domain protein [Aspergillus fischeri NRRL 181]EAW22039.1 PAZ domain protein [Aspergillus fischeri NRRL 181]KAG2001030.1 hypothetical protein GB937_010572 [Aspergillus fischeri]